MLLYDHRRLRSNALTCSPMSDYSSTNNLSNTCSPTNNSSTQNQSKNYSSTQFSSIREELQWIRQHLTDKEDELAKAMNQVEDLTYHLKNVKNFRSLKPHLLKIELNLLQSVNYNCSFIS